MKLRSRFDLLSFAEKSAEMVLDGTFYDFAHSSGEFNKRELERLLQGIFFQPECNSGEWAKSLVERLYSLFLEFSLPPLPPNFKPWQETDLSLAYESLERKFKDFQEDFERKDLDKISYVQKLHSVKNEIEIEVSNIKYYLKEFRNFPKFDLISRQDLKKDFPELDAVQNSIFYCDETLTWLADLNIQIADEITAVKKIHESQKAHPGFQFNPKRYRRNGDTVHYFAFGIVAYKKTFEKEYTVAFDGCNKCLFTAKKIKEIPEMLRDFLVGKVPHKFRSFSDFFTCIKENQKEWNLRYFPTLGSWGFRFKELEKYYKEEFPEFYSRAAETTEETPEENPVETPEEKPEETPAPEEKSAPVGNPVPEEKPEEKPAPVGTSVSTYIPFYLKPKKEEFLSLGGGFYAYKRGKYYTVKFDGYGILFPGFEKKDLNPENLTKNFLVPWIKSHVNFQEFKNKLESHSFSPRHESASGIVMWRNDLKKWIEKTFPGFVADCDEDFETPAEIARKEKVEFFEKIEEQFQEKEKELQSKIASLENELQKFQKENETLQRTLDAVSAQCEEFRIRTESEKSQLETELETAKAEFKSELERTEAVFNQEKFRMETELKNAKAEFQEELERTEAGFRQEKSQLETELEAAKKEFQEELERTEAGFCREKSRLETELKNAKTKPAVPPVPSIPIQKIEKTFSALKNENANLRSRIAILETQFQDLKQKIPIPKADKLAKKEKRKESWLPYITAFVAFVVYMLA